MKQGNLKLPEPIQQRLGTQAGRQRAIVEEGALLLVLHQVPSPEERERVAVLFHRTADGSWHSSERGPGLPALKQLLDRYDERISELDDAYESADSSYTYLRVLESVAPLVRAARNLHAALQSAREAIGPAPELIEVRDHAETIQRTIELLQEDARNGLTYRIAEQAEAQAVISRRMATASHRLNLVAAVFFPLTAFGSMLGVNMRTGLETRPVEWFWILFATVVFAGCVLYLRIATPQSAPVTGVTARRPSASKSRVE